MHVCHGTHVGRSEGDLWELLFIFQHLSPEDRNLVLKLGSKTLQDRLYQ